MDAIESIKENESILYRNAKHGISKWTIWSEGSTIFFASESKLGDNPTCSTEIITHGKAGRTLKNQVLLRIDSRKNSKLDHGYVSTIEEARKPLTNQMGLFQPMLAIKFKDLKVFNYKDYYEQDKLDGHRCMITRQGGELIAYSRGGKVIKTIKHILDGLQIEDGTTLDGELYVHGESLQTIASWAKRQQPDSFKLKFVCYDLVASNMPYEERYEILRRDIITANYRVDGFQLLYTQKLNTPDVFVKMRGAKGAGYEGLILRHKDYSYEVGRRSKGLVKVKSCEDAEFEVVDVIPSKWNWGILVCKIPGDTFKTPAPGTLFQKEEVLNHKEKYIGKFITCEFANYTKDGKPFHAVALRWRTDL